MALALYDPTVGYYRQPRKRVGYAAGTDFFTASTSGPIFGELVATACAKLLRDSGRDPGAHVFVEVGAEPGGGVLKDVAHPFASIRTVRVGEKLEITGDAVVFSNELFDAQPCERTVRRDDAWREIAVRIDGERLVEFEQPSYHNEPICPNGYHFDRPVAAATLADEIAAQLWRGLFIAFDYGKTLSQLAQETPQGTARAYFRHHQSNDLLARPGEQDLTCHVCWDWISDALERRGFAKPRLDFQETFLIRQAGEAIAAMAQADASRLSSRKLSLMQLLHPGQLGQKFQVLHALR